MNKFMTTALSLSTVFIGAIEAQAATLNIDSFDGEFQEVEVNLRFSDTGKKTEQATSGLDSNILGGFRTIFVEAERTGLSGGDSKGQVAQTGVSTGIFNFDNDSGIQGLTKITYDANGSGLSPLNLLDTGADTNAFSLDVISIDLNAQLTFTVVGGSGQAVLVKSGLNSGETAVFSYEEFTSSGDMLDNIFSDVDSISFEATGPAAFDATFDNLQAVKTGVPESSSVLSLIGLAALATGAGLKNQVGKKS